MSLAARADAPDSPRESFTVFNSWLMRLAIRGFFRSSMMDSEIILGRAPNWINSGTIFLPATIFTMPI